MTVVLDPNLSLRTLASSGVRARGSNTILLRSGPRHSGLGRGISRRVKDGSSDKIVFTPTIMASPSCRSFMPSRRAKGPVIHLESPLTLAILPSSVIAAFTVTKGMPVVIQ